MTGLEDQSATGEAAAKRKRAPRETQELSETAKRARLTQAKDSDNVKGDDFGCNHLGIKEMITKRISTTIEFNFHSQEGNILKDNMCKGCKKPMANIDKEKKCPISEWYICYCEIGHTFRDDHHGLTCRVVFCYTCAMVQVGKNEAAAGGGVPQEGGSCPQERCNEAMRSGRREYWSSDWVVESEVIVARDPHSGFWCSRIK